MTKEEIDRLVQILKSNELAIENIDELLEMYAPQNLRHKMQNMIQEMVTGNEAVEAELDKLCNQLLENIHSQIPEDLREYFYFEAIDKNIMFIFLNEQQVNEAKKVYSRKIEEIMNLPDAEKIKVCKKIHRKNIKKRIIASVSDAEKIFYLKGLAYDFEKYEIMLLIENPEKRIEALNELEDEYNKYWIIESLGNNPQLDDIKIRALGELQEQNIKAKAICTIVDNDKKIKALGQLEDDFAKVYVIESMDDDKKYEALDELVDEESWEKVVRTINNPEVLKKLEEDRKKSKRILKIEDLDEKIKALKELERDRHKADIIKTIKDEGKRLEIALQELKRDSYKVCVIKTIKTDEIKLKALKFFKGQEWFEIAKTLSFESKIELLKNCEEQIQIKLIGMMGTQEEVLKGLECLEGENKEVLKRLYRKNNDVLNNIDVRILGECYLETLGEDKINQISCYPEIQSAILSLPEKEYFIFEMCLNTYISEYETGDWTIIAQVILKNLQRGNYIELIGNIEDFKKVNPENMLKILCLKNYFDIKNIDDIENYEEIMRKKSDEIINEKKDLYKMKNVTLIKLFGLDIEEAKKILDKYGDEIDCVEGDDEKDFIKAIQEIVRLKSVDVVKQIYDEVGRIWIGYKGIMERRIKNEYAKKYNESLFETKLADKINDEYLPNELIGLNVYDAGIDFNMIITSVGAYSLEIIENYKKDWNRPVIASQHFCASYIRNDMLGTARIINICYGFTQMKEDSLMLMGRTDLNSSVSSFVPFGNDDKFYSPDNMINKTEGQMGLFGEEVAYNEMCYRRIQGGEKKQPDYIVAFRKGGKIKNIDEIAKAAQDWEGKLPVVIIDVDRCLESERAKILGDEQNERAIGIF